MTAGIAVPGLFEVFEARPALGRLLAEQDLQTGSHQVVVLSDALWHQLGGDPRSVGRLLSIDDEPHRVVGVLQPLTEAA